MTTVDGVLANTQYEDLPKRQRRRLVVVGTLRAVITAAILVTLYYILPLDHGGDVKTIAELVIGIAVIGVVAYVQIRGIIGSDYPTLRAAEALAFTVPLYLLLFATTYYLMDMATVSSFTSALTRTDALYFAVTVFTTVGFGDIAAKTEAARLLVTIQMILDLVFVGLVVRLIIQAVKLGQHHNGDAGR